MFKTSICSKIYHVSCTNTPHDVTDLVNMGWLEIKKLEYFENRTFLRNKKINLCLR